MSTFAGNKRVVNVMAGMDQVQKVYAGETMVWEKLYTPLNYIESTGTQYINSGVPLNSNSRIVVDAAVTRRVGSNIIAGNYTANKRFAINILDTGTDITTFYGASNKPTTGLNSNTRAILDMDGQNLTVKLNGITIWDLVAQAYFTATTSCGIFAAILENGTANYHSIMKLYAMQIYQGGEIVRDFIPVKRDSDNVVGLLDKITNAFYTNVGSGNFNFSEL